MYVKLIQRLKLTQKLKTDSDMLLMFVFQLWVQERTPVATSTDHGHNLQTVQLLIKKNQVRESVQVRDGVW